MLIVALIPASHAQTDEIQVYDASIAEPGTFGLDLHSNYTASGSKTPAFPGGITPEHSVNGTVEWAYGVKDWFEAGLYLPLYSLTNKAALTYNGAKVRALFVSPHAADRKIFYGVNFEFSVNTAHWDTRRYTSEIRPIIGAHLGRFDIVFNPIVDNSYTGLAHCEFVPATRVAMKVSGNTRLALEEYDNFGELHRFSPANQQTHQLFLVADHHTPWVDIELGIGAGLTSATDHRVIKLILMKDL